jgi:hypothetical protein
MSQEKRPSPNDQRSNVKNPNNDAFKKDRDNRSDQLNPNHEPTKRGGDEPRGR